MRRSLISPGAICEFGVHFGASANVSTQIRYIQESSIANRDLFLFDTFNGFVGTNKKDGSLVEEGDFQIQFNYEKFLTETLDIQEFIRGLFSAQGVTRNRMQIYKGDATDTVQEFLFDHPESGIALLILDMDIYSPTIKVLESLIPRLTKGSIVVLDEFNHPNYPGETIAIRELLGTHKIAIRKTKFAPYCAWFIWE